MSSSYNQVWHCRCHNAKSDPLQVHAHCDILLLNEYTRFGLRQVPPTVLAAEVWEAAALAADVSVYVSTLIEWGIPIAYTVPIWSDSESAKWIAQDARAVKRIAYIARRCRFLQELEARGIIKILKILGTKNPVNCLTKATVTFEEFLTSFDYITGGATSLLNLK